MLPIFFGRHFKNFFDSNNKLRKGLKRYAYYCLFESKVFREFPKEIFFFLKINLKGLKWVQNIYLADFFIFIHV